MCTLWSESKIVAGKVLQCGKDVTCIEHTAMRNERAQQTKLVRCVQYLRLQFEQHTINVVKLPAMILARVIFG